MDLLWDQLTVGMAGMVGMAVTLRLLWLRVLRATMFLVVLGELVQESPHKQEQQDQPGQPIPHLRREENK